VSTAEVVGDVEAPRSGILTDLVESFEAYFAEHRGCAALAAAIVEAEQSDAAWAVAWMVCVGCGVRWERHLKLHA
jgi:hypothetical protein